MKIKDVRTITVDLPGRTWVVSPEIRTFGCVYVWTRIVGDETGRGIYCNPVNLHAGSYKIPCSHSLPCDTEPV